MFRCRWEVASFGAWSTGSFRSRAAPSSIRSGVDRLGAGRIRHRPGGWRFRCRLCQQQRELGQRRGACHRRRGCVPDRCREPVLGGRIAPVSVVISLVKRNELWRRLAGSWWCWARCWEPALSLPTLAPRHRPLPSSLGLRSCLVRRSCPWGPSCFCGMLIGLVARGERGERSQQAPTATLMLLPRDIGLWRSARSGATVYMKTRRWPVLRGDRSGGDRCVGGLGRRGAR